METTEIIQLAEVLRDNGAEVLNGTSKLTLSADLLCSLNNSFSLVIDQRDVMSSSFHVINSNSSKMEVFRNLQFLHDFVQRAAGLKLTPSKNAQEFIDITKFKNLKLLDVQKLPVNTIFGLQMLRSQLQFLICTRSIGYLSDVLEKCGGDQSEGMVWNELREGVFSHNALQILDSSLKFTPNLNVLDLSHNEIKDANPLNCLPNLKHLNLAYNKLNSLPTFTGQICNRLQVLVLKNNFIEDINDVIVLSNLSELDLAENCLIEHKMLLPLANLATLQCLNLEGNPLSYHPQHRTKTASCLHLNTATVRFLLNRVILSKSEQKLVGSLHPRITSRAATLKAPTDNLELPAEKPRRIRNATISDSEHSPIIDSSYTSISSLTPTNEHLETKRQIEQLRELYGEKWLHSQAGSLVQDALGLEKTPLPASSTPYGSVDILIQSELKPREFLESKLDENQTTAEVYVTANESETVQESSLYPNETPESPDVPSEDEDLSEEGLYLATIKGETDQVFIVITKTHILEKECTNTKERARWPIDTLIRCEKHETHLQLYFDTLKTDKKQRQYIFEEEESERLQKALKNVIDTRAPEDERLVMFKCLKCLTTFGVEGKKSKGDGQTACPVCKSPLVFEDA